MAMNRRGFSVLLISFKSFLFTEMPIICNAFQQPLGPKCRQGYQTIGDVTTHPTTSSNIHAAFDDEELPQSSPSNSEMDSFMSKSTGQKILDLSIPALGALLIDPLLTIADTAFVGRYSDSANELAGMGSAAALLTFSFYLFNFLCTATTPLVSAKRSGGKESEALETGGQALSLAFILGGILSVGLIVLRQPLLSIMGTSISGPDANAYAIDFLTMRAVAAPAVFCISASTGILRGYLDTKTPIVILVLANIVNLVLDVVLIVYARMGPAGAAIATTTAEWISALLFLGVLSGRIPSADGQLGKKDKKTLVVTPALSIPPWEEVQPLITASASIFFRSLSLQISLSAAAAFAARGGETFPGGAASSISAHQIAIQLWVLCSFISDALAAASQGLVADGMGRNDIASVREVSSTVFVYSAILGVILATMLQIGESTGFLLNFFTSDQGTQTALSEILTIIVLAQPLNSIVFAADGVLQGAAEFAYQAKTMALSAATAAATFILLQEFGYADTLVDVWLALITLQIMRGLTSAIKIMDRDGPIRLLSSSSSSSTTTWPPNKPP